MESTPKFDMAKWIEGKKAKGQWTGNPDADKQYHKPFTQTAKPVVTTAKPFSPIAKPVAPATK